MQQAGQVVGAAFDEAQDGRGEAKAVLKVGRNAYVRNLAKHIVNEQGAENDVMAKLLAA